MSTFFLELLPKPFHLPSQRPKWLWKVLAAHSAPWHHSIQPPTRCLLLDFIHWGFNPPVFCLPFHLISVHNLGNVSTHTGEGGLSQYLCLPITCPHHPTIFFPTGSFDVAVPVMVPNINFRHCSGTSISCPLQPLPMPCFLSHPFSLPDLCTYFPFVPEGPFTAHHLAE